MISATETAAQPTPTASAELSAADTTTGAGESPADATTVSPEVTTQLEKSSAKGIGHGFTPARLERIISALAKLIEAFAALSRARRDQQPAQPTLEAPKEPATVEPQPIQVKPEPDSTSTPSTPSPQAETSAPTELSSGPTQQATISGPADQPETPSRSVTIQPPAIKPRQPVRRGNALGNSSGFLWKPKSDKDGKLAILLPPHMTGKVADVAILSPDGMRTLQRGRYSGSGNGEREHFRFSKPGGDFPDGAIVVIIMKDGSRQHLEIKETSARVQK